MPYYKGCDQKYLSTASRGPFPFFQSLFPVIKLLGSLKSLVEDCWSDTPQKRPPFKAILKRLEAVIVDSAILDQSANIFWRKSFKDQPFVNWTEFLDVIAMEIALIPVLSPFLHIIFVSSHYLDRGASRPCQSLFTPRAPC
jgi:hypothetical protein